MNLIDNLTDKVQTQLQLRQMQDKRSLRAKQTD